MLIRRSFAVATGCFEGEKEFPLVYLAPTGVNRPTVLDVCPIPSGAGFGRGVTLCPHGPAELSCTGCLVLWVFPAGPWSVSGKDAVPTAFPPISGGTWRVGIF